MTPSVVDSMARKESNPREDWERKPLAVQVRGSTDWKAWVERLGKFDHLAVAPLVERALIKYAKDIGFPDPPPSR